jgi:hypothetical protein
MGWDSPILVLRDEMIPSTVWLRGDEIIHVSCLFLGVEILEDGTRTRQMEPMFQFYF